MHEAIGCSSRPSRPHSCRSSITGLPNAATHLIDKFSNLGVETREQTSAVAWWLFAPDPLISGCICRRKENHQGKYWGRLTVINSLRGRCPRPCGQSRQSSSTTPIQYQGPPNSHATAATFRPAFFCNVLYSSTIFGKVGARSLRSPRVESCLVHLLL